MQDNRIRKLVLESGRAYFFGNTNYTDNFDHTPGLDVLGVDTNADIAGRVTNISAVMGLTLKMELYEEEGTLIGNSGWKPHPPRQVAMWCGSMTCRASLRGLMCRLLPVGFECVLRSDCPVRCITIPCAAVW
jgi:hypothetical protein